MNHYPYTVTKMMAGERQGTQLFLAFPANYADGEVTYRE